MPHVDLVARGAQVMTVCNACRYCEQYCPVFPAMERRVAFGKADLAYLANLCHNCGECLYACQYAPPHEFGINVPTTLAQLRIESYADYCWPRPFGVLFRKQGLMTSLAVAAVFTAVLLASVRAVDTTNNTADFYAIIPHATMVTLFGAVFVFALIAIGIGLTRFSRDVRRAGPLGPADVRRAGPFGPAEDRTADHRKAFGPAALIAVRDALTLRHLHPAGIDCVSTEENRSPWRRWCHHFTFYGFMLCFASTTVAAIYHSVFGWLAPYAYTSAPVVLGATGGAGLLVGTVGLFLLRRDRDAALGGQVQRGLDESFIALLFLTAVTGLALLFLRHTNAMAPLLAVHLGIVLALFVTLPYGKFVHGLYRLAALMIDASEEPRR
jgi:citrate/tricarballylate utilization protein